MGIDQARQDQMRAVIDDRDVFRGLRPDIAKRAAGGNAAVLDQQAAILLV